MKACGMLAWQPGLGEVVVSNGLEWWPGCACALHRLSGLHNLQT
jgi:hypothetical protein